MGLKSCLSTLSVPHNFFFHCMARIRKCIFCNGKLNDSSVTINMLVNKVNIIDFFKTKPIPVVFISRSKFLNGGGGGDGERGREREVLEKLLPLPTRKSSI